MTVQAIIGTYIIIQLWANTMGLTVLFVLDNVINKSLRDRGYTNLPITTSDKIRKFCKGVLKFFIPFYYCLKGINLVCDTSSFESVVDDKIKNGEVMPFIRKPKPIEVKKEESPIIEPLVMTESYKAIPNGKSLYNQKMEVISKFDGELIKPEENLVTPFAKKPIQIENKSKEEELFEYIQSKSKDELNEIISSLNAYKEAKEVEPINAYRLTLEDKKVA